MIFKKLCTSGLLFLSGTFVYSCDTFEALDLAVNVPKKRIFRYYSTISDHRTVNLQPQKKSSRLFNNYNAWEQGTFRLRHDFDMEYERVKRGISCNPLQVLFDLSRMNYPPAQFMLATFLQNQNGFENMASELMKQAAGAGHPFAQIERALAAYRQNDFDVAENYFNLAAQSRFTQFSSFDVTKKIVYKSAWMDWAIIKATEKKFSDAELLFQKCVDGGHYAMLSNLGVLSAQRGDNAKALELYKKALVHPHVSADIKQRALQGIFDTQSGETLHAVALEMAKDNPKSSWVRPLLQESNKRGFEAAFRVLLQQAHTINDRDALWQLLEEALQNRLLTISDESTVKIIGQIVTKYSEKSKAISYTAYKIYRDGLLGIAKDPERAKIFFLRAVKNGYFLYGEEMPTKKSSKDFQTVDICLKTLNALRDDFHPDFEYASTVINPYLSDLASGKQPNVYAVVNKIQTNYATMQPSQMTGLLQTLLLSNDDQLIPFLKENGCLSTIVTYAEQHKDHHDLLCSSAKFFSAAIKQKQIEASDPVVKTMSDLLFRKLEQKQAKGVLGLLTLELLTLQGDVPSLLCALETCNIDSILSLSEKSDLETWNRCVQSVKACADNDKQAFAADAAYIICTLYRLIQRSPSYSVPCLSCKKENLTKTMERYGQNSKRSMIALYDLAKKFFDAGDFKTAAEHYYQLYIQASSHDLSRFSNYYKRLVHKELLLLAQHQQAPALACLFCCVLEQDEHKCLNHFLSALKALYSHMVPTNTFEEYAQKTKAIVPIQQSAAADNPEANHLLGLYYGFIAENKSTHERLVCMENAEHYARRAYRLDPQEKYKKAWANSSLYLGQVYTGVDRLEGAFLCLDYAATYGDETMKGEALCEFAELYASGKCGMDKEAGKKSIELLEQAAACGDSSARSKLGTILIDGGLKIGSCWYSVEKNVEEGKQYLESVATKEVNAAEKLEELQLEGLLSLHNQALELYRDKKYQQAKEFFEQSVKSGCKFSLYYLAILKMNGYGTPRDASEALDLLEQFEKDLSEDKSYYIPEFKFTLVKKISQSYVDVADSIDVTPQIKTRALCNYICSLMNRNYKRDSKYFKALMVTIDHIEKLVQQNPEYKAVWFERGCDKALQSEPQQNFALLCRQLRFYSDHYLPWGERLTELEERIVKPFANTVAGDLTEYDGECDGIAWMPDTDFELLYKSLKKLAESNDAQPCDHYALGILTLAAALNNKQNLIPITTGKKKKPNEVKKQLLALGFKEIKKAADAGDYLALYFLVGHLVSTERKLSSAILNTNTSKEKSDYLGKLRECAKSLDDKATYFNGAMIELKDGNTGEAVHFFLKSLGLPSREKTAISYGYICDLSAQSLNLQSNSKEDQKNLLRTALHHGVLFFDMSVEPTENDSLILRFIDEQNLLTHIARCDSKINELFDAQDPEKERLRCLLYYCMANAYALSGRYVVGEKKDAFMKKAFQYIKAATEFNCEIEPRILCLYAHYLLRQSKVDEQLVQDLLTRSLHVDSQEPIDQRMIKKVMDQFKAYKQKTSQPKRILI